MLDEIKSSQDVHKMLVTGAEHSWTLGLMAYAIVEDQKHEWISHVSTLKHREPTHPEIEEWFLQRTPESFHRAIADAENTLQLVADDALKEIIEIERREVLEQAVIQSIERHSGGWRQFGIGVAAGLVSALLFAVLIIIVAVIVLDNRSLVDLAKIASTEQINEEDSIQGDGDGSETGESRSHQ